MERKLLKRGPRLTIRQKQLILQFAEENPNIQRIKIDSNFTLQEKNNLWLRLANLLNSDGLGAVKTPEEWHETWNNWKSTVRSQYVKIKQYARGTGGGGPTINRLSIEDETLMTMIGTIHTEGNPEIKEIGFQIENADETSTMEEGISTEILPSTPVEEVIVECVVPEEKSFGESVATNFHDYIEISQLCDSSGASPNTPITRSTPHQAFLNGQNRNRRRRELPVERAARNFSEFQKMQAEATSELTEAIKDQTKALIRMTCVLEKLAAKLT